LDFGTRRIIINTAVGTWARVASLVVAFFTAPVLFNHLGTEQFGLFAILGSLAAYAGLLDFGIGPGLVKHFTEYSEKNDPLAVRQVTTFAALFYLVIGLVFLPLVYFASPALVDLLSIRSEMQPMARFCITAMFLYFVLSCMSGIFSARLVSLHRMDITAAIGLAGQIIYGLFVFVIIPIWPTVLAAISLVFVQLIVNGVATIVVVTHMEHRVFADPRTIPPMLIRRLFAFGGWMQLNSLSALINLEADKLIIAGFVNLDTVAFYQLGNRLASLNRIIPFQLLSAVMPAATGVIIKSDPGAVEDLYRNTSRYLMLMTMSITGFVSAAAGHIVTVWLGKPYPEAAYVTIALSVSFAINNLTGAGTTIVRGAGLPRYETYYAWVSTALNIVITIGLAKPFGIVGILAGTIIGNIIGSIYFLALFHRVFKFPWFRTMGTWLWKLVAATCIACGSVWLAELIYPVGGAVNRWLELSLVGASGLLYMAVFIGALTLLKFWTGKDLDMFRRAIPHVPVIRRSI
jgi:O-antigen/teichoic acid export membrane protein